MTKDLAQRIEQYGVVAVIYRDGRFLVIERSPWVRAPGTFCFPGGGIEPGESEEETVCREMLEELGCRVTPLRRVWNSVTSWHVALTWWRVQLSTDVTFTPNAQEVASYHWLNADQMLSMPKLLQSNRDFLTAWRRGEFTL